MGKLKLLATGFFAAILIIGCEIPKKPNFTTSHKVEAPFLYDKTFQFMGSGPDALIDTSKSDFDSLFTVDDNTNLITLSKEQDFDFGDLNDAVPEVDVDPTSFNSQVGEIEIGNLSSDDEGNLGEANFQDLTNIDPNTVSQGDPVPPQSASPEVTIDLDTDYFTSATFNGGALDITLINNLGFNLDNINATLVSNPDGSPSVDIVTDGTGAVNDAESSTLSLPFNDGDELANPSVRVSISWSSSLNSGDPDYQEFQREPVSLVVSSAQGNNLTASQVVAAVESQDFNTSNTTVFSERQFRFEQPDHYVQLESGSLEIDPIQNDIDIDVETLVISFPGIREAPFTPADSLVIQYGVGAGETAIPRNGSSVAKNRDLSGYRIYAEDNEIRYNVVAETENTQQGAGSSNREINETDELSSTVNINNLVVAEANGIVVTKKVLLGDDDTSNGERILDIFNDNETELTEIDGLSDLSRQLDGLQFTQPTLSINYTTNVGIETTVYGAILGIDGSGNEVYLTGNTGSGYAVNSTDPISGLYANGDSISVNNLVKFPIDTSPDGSDIEGAVVFDETNSTVDNFLNNLPSEIRFVGKAVINESQQEGTVSTPINFDPKISIDIPLAFRTTTAATYTDTTEQEGLQDVPSAENSEDNSRISEAILTIEYTNGLPLEVNLELIFLDESNNVVTREPLNASDDPLTLEASGVGPNAFAINPTPGELVLSLDEGQLNQFHKARYMVVKASLLTTDTNGDGSGNEVKIRTEDSVTLSVRAEVSLQTDVN